MSSDIVDLDSMRLATWLADRIDNYVERPPDTDFNVGYLAAMVDAYPAFEAKMSRESRPQ
ncbi:hypothetical protein [Mesorhizobium sp.]|uniref:hypothetical protein n=1 Tax=Mesorhizobium sp. TaxID=1871066 RepID=UPI000FE7C224|nr:hypothetical protein [Mesorhizobium sp.]RWB06320.1 MAG: hypothetical protein EOQ33_06320 [Mesorhizobium sp.]